INPEGRVPATGSRVAASAGGRPATGSPRRRGHDRPDDPQVPARRPAAEQALRADVAEPAAVEAMRAHRRCGLTTPAFPGLPPGETAICHVTGYGLDPDALVRYPVLRCVNEARP